MTTVSIERIAAGGEGVGRLESGIAVFVPRTAPGDVAEIAVVERKRRYLRGRLQTLDRASRDRVEPACRHYGGDACGGCQLQHLSSAAQRAAKRVVVGDAMRRIAHRQVVDPPIVPSPAAWQYRTKITLAAAGGAIGFHRYDAPDRVFDLDDCLLASERLMALWTRVREHRALLPDALESLVLREDRHGGLHVIAVGGGVAWDASPLAERIGGSEVSFWWAPTKGAARVVAGELPAFPAFTFEQANPELATTIQAAAVDALGSLGGRIVWDLYGGVGDAADLVIERGAQVWTVDADRQAVAWARRRDRSRPAGQPVRIAARVEESLHRLPEPFAIIVNPPRTGLHRQVAARLERWGQAASGRLVYVSCDPATLARDLARMPSLTLRTLVAYDLFPQTSHVETLAVLEAE